MAWLAVATMLLTWAAVAGLASVAAVAVAIWACRRYVFGGPTEPGMYSIAFFHPYW
jgi:hypothetical protein